MKKPIKIKHVIILAIVMLFLTVFYKSCVPRKLNEATFYEDEHIELKVVRYFENLPLHFNGNVYRIMAKSINTAKNRKIKHQDRGWKRIAKHSGFTNMGPDPQLTVLVEAARQGYHVTDEGTMIFASGLGVFVTWDACGTLRQWYVEKIPEERLLPYAAHDKCLKESKEKEKSGALPEGWAEKNCWSYRFSGDHQPRFWALAAKKEGHASFKAASKAFKETGAYFVETRDFGKTWHMRALAAE